jgi:hypothetical protein
MAWSGCVALTRGHGYGSDWRSGVADAWTLRSSARIRRGGRGGEVQRALRVSPDARLHGRDQRSSRRRTAAGERRCEYRRRPDHGRREITSNLDLAGWPAGSRGSYGASARTPARTLLHRPRRAPLPSEPHRPARRYRARRARSPRSRQSRGSHSQRQRQGYATCLAATSSTTASGSTSYGSPTTSSGGPNAYHSPATSPKQSPNACATASARRRRLAFHARTATLRPQANRPWAVDLTTASTRLRAIPTPAG